MTGVFKRKLKSGESWGYSFFAGRTPDGKRIQVFKSGFDTKKAAADARREALAEYERQSGKVSREVNTEGQREWSFELDGKRRFGFASKSAAIDGLRLALALREADRLTQFAQQESARTEQERQDKEKAGPAFTAFFKKWIAEHASRRCSRL